MSLADRERGNTPKRDGGGLAGALPAATLPLAGAESRLSAAAAGLAATARTGRPLPGES